MKLMFFFQYYPHLLLKLKIINVAYDHEGESIIEYASYGGFGFGELNNER